MNNPNGKGKISLFNLASLWLSAIVAKQVLAQPARPMAWPLVAQAS
jgi:hypothetical protein